jgi:mono/diheme cytochrome c family protein
MACKRVFVITACGGLALFLACARPALEPSPVVTPEAKKEAEAIFTARCVSCHGQSGDGNGPSAASLRPRPRNFQDKMWQSNVTDRQIERIIRFGGGAGGKSPVMPANPDLVSKPQVVAALRDLVRSFGK